ncbi:MAG: NrdH-redoxin [Candidatus Nealsonbacteria bacterium]|nr:NrdH-redoxin [Candidatus Nealsonbacteria bacterium]
MVKIYTTPYCPYCSTLKQYLTDHGIEFTDIDVSQNKEERDDMIERSGQIGVPVVDIDGSIVAGFDKEKIDKLLKINCKVKK